MQPESSHDPRRRERVADNVYRRFTSAGAVVYEARFRDADGRDRQRRLAATTERDALREARALLARRDGGERVTPAAVTLREFVASEFEPLLVSLAAAGRRSPQGVRLDSDHLRLYILPALGDLRLGAIEGADVAAMLRELRCRRRKSRPAERALSEGSLRITLTVLRAVFRLARSRRVVTRSPLDELDPGELPRPRSRKRGRRLDERELDTLVRHASDGYRIAAAILAYTGVRVSEALALRWQDVDFVDREITVSGQLTRATVTTQARVVPRKGGADPYVTLLFPALENILVGHLADEQRAGRGRDGDFVLATRSGRPLAQGNVLNAVKDAAARAGLGTVTPHDLRRSFCSLAARRGVDPVQAAAMTGHSLDVWARYYAGDYGKTQRDEARKKMISAGFGVTKEMISTGFAVATGEVRGHGAATEPFSS